MSSEFDSNKNQDLSPNETASNASNKKMQGEESKHSKSKDEEPKRPQTTGSDFSEHELPRTPESERAASSRASGSLGRQTPSVSRRRRKGPPPDAHPVTFTVAISMAVPTVLDEEQKDIVALMRKKGRIIEAPRAQTYYHLEYVLVPRAASEGTPVRTSSSMSQRFDEVLEEGMRVDMVTYGLFAKVYPEKGEARIIRTWQEGDRTWIVWDHTHTLNVSRETLQRLADHTVQVRVWDQKEKCSTRARFDRPKAFQLPQPKPGEAIDEAGGVKKKALRETKRYQKCHHRRTQVDRALPGQLQQEQIDVPLVKEPSTRGAGPGTEASQHKTIGGQTSNNRGSAQGASASRQQLTPPRREDKAPSPQGPPTELLASAVPDSQIDPDKRSFSRLGELAGERLPQTRRSPKSSAKATSPADEPAPSSRATGRVQSRSTVKAEREPAREASPLKSSSSRQPTVAPDEASASADANSTAATASESGSPQNRPPISRPSTKPTERSLSRGSGSKPMERSCSRGGSTKPSERSASQGAASGSASQHSRRSSQDVNARPSSQGAASQGHGNQASGSQAPSRQPSAAGGATTARGSAVAGKRNRKAEAEAKAQYELELKTGKCTVDVRTAPLFAGQKLLSARLETQPLGIEDMLVSVVISDTLMSEEQRRDLNPLILTVGAANSMPATPISYLDLQSRCEPAYVRYNLLGQKPHTTVGRAQGSSIYWSDMRVILAGCLEQSVLREALSGPLLEMEVHDRDRRAAERELRATLFGEDLEDEKIANVGTVAARRTNYSAFETRNTRPWDPFGVAKFDLSELLLSATHLYLKAPIHNCRIPEFINMRENTRVGGKLLGISGAVDGPGDAPLPMGHYMESHSYLKIKVDVAFPLVKPTEVAAKPFLPTTNECPFGRLVYRFPYNHTRLLHKLYRLVSRMNAEALGLINMPPHVLESALSTYKLSQEQQHAIDLDIVTGFQVMDSKWHIFVLEGLRERSIATIWETLPQTENSDMVVLHNSDLGFARRLYGTLDVDLTRIKLHEPLDVIVCQPLLYVRDMVPRPCLQALSSLHQMLESKLLQHAVRNNLFPSAEAVVSMSREFGVPLTAADFQELAEKPFSESLTRTSEKESEESLRDSLEKVYPVQGRATRRWSPLDNYNVDYVQHLEDAGEKTDHISQNIQAVQQVSEENRVQREATQGPGRLVADVEIPAHNYSTQTLNSTEQARSKLRQLLTRETPGQLYTYCQEYSSGTLQPVGEREDSLRERTQSEQKRVYARDWRYPGVKSTVDCNKHPEKPGTPRREELAEPFEDNVLHHNVLEPTLQRDRYSWAHRDKDFNVWTRPKHLFDPNAPVTIHESGVKLEAEKLAQKAKDKKQWESKLVVNNPRFVVKRLALETEMREKGSKSSNQIDRLSGILKDAPNKISLSRGAMVLKDVPPLSVVNYPGVDTAARAQGVHLPPAFRGREKTFGYAPGAYETRSWVLEKNRVPIYNYNHSYFTDSIGSDFNAQYKERQVISKRSMPPLSDAERNVDLFRPHLPPHPGDYFRQLTEPELSKIGAHRQQVASGI